LSTANWRSWGRSPDASYGATADDDTDAFFTSAGDAWRATNDGQAARQWCARTKLATLQRAADSKRHARIGLSANPINRGGRARVSQEQSRTLRCCIMRDASERAVLRT